jgi:hypothetical protein
VAFWGWRRSLSKAVAKQARHGTFTLSAPAPVYVTSRWHFHNILCGLFLTHSLHQATKIDRSPLQDGKLSFPDVSGQQLRSTRPARRKLSFPSRPATSLHRLQSHSAASTMGSPSVVSRSFGSPVPPTSPIPSSPLLPTATVSDRAQLLYLKVEAEVLRAQVHRLQELFAENECKRAAIITANWEPTVD